MVRHKTRWLLVRLEFAEDKEVTPSTFPSKKDFSTLVEESLYASFGLASHHAALNMQVRFVDHETGLILMRVPRKDCGMVRAAVCLLTNLDIGGRARPPKVVASVVSVNGSARTAKLATMAHLRQEHGKKLRDNNIRTSELRNECNHLETKLSAIQNID